MKRPLQLPLAIALALGGTNALALGLGPVHVNSKLNQPLDAEIPVLQGTAGEAEGLLVNLAASEDFERIGLNRSRLNVPLEFAVVKSAKGELVIKITSKEAVRDSFLDFLVEANWPKGRLLREYTILLDPPLTAPASHAATTSAVAATPSTSATTPRREKPVEPAVTATPRPSTPRPAAAATTAAPKNQAKDGEYGPVEAGQTLSEVAREARPGGNLNQTMIALLKANPNAFYKDNINALKRGAILRIPSADETKAVGSASEAAAQVQSQVEDWRGGRASPTLVTDAASRPAATTPAANPAKKAPATTASAGKSASERLELVPPKAGKDSMAMADRPGSGAGSAAATELKSELARTKETLTSREQETGELRSRVKELEELKGKNDRLIGLKDSEIAELQQKLKQLQDTSGSTAKTTGAVAATAAAASKAPSTASTPAAGANDKIGKQDIWGEAGASKTTTPDTAKTPAAPVTSTGTPASSSATTPASTSPPGSTTASTASTAAAIPSAANSTPAATGTTPPTSSGAPAPNATTPAAASSAATTPSTETPVTVPPVKPVTPKPAVVKAKPAPLAEPWYEESWVKPAALGAGVLLLLLGLLGLRKRRPAATVERTSIAGAFGDSPFDVAAGANGSANDAEEAKLLEHLQGDPSNVGLHLELLSLYYAERDIAKFEYAAADMHTHVTDEHQPEWLEAQAMGQELAPRNPLFAGPAYYDDVEHVADDADFDTVERPHLHADDTYDAHAHHPAEAFDAPPHHHQDLPPVHTPQTLDSGFAFDLDDAHPTAPPAVPVAKHDDGFDFDLPPLDFDAPPPAHAASGTHDLHDVHASALPAAAPAARLDDDYFPGDDAIGTKLDLAKAYMDMGDPEGARSMLEEVVAEGSDVQKAEAHRLMAEIR